MAKNAKREDERLPDARLDARYERIVSQLGRRPADSFPEQFRNPSELEAFYRFVNNDRVEASELVRVAALETLQRCVGMTEVVLAHDTTEFSYSTEREGLGRITDGGNGCFAHFTIGVTADAMRDVVGVVGLQAFTRSGPPQRKKGRHTERKEEKDRESARWWKAAFEAEHFFASTASCIHTMDREADSYLLLSRFHAHGMRFVCRIRANRRVAAGTSKKLFETMETMSATFTREVTLSSRDSVKKAHPSREARTATLEVAAGVVTLRRPAQPERTEDPLPETLTFNVIHVRERNTPEGEQPVDWKLITSEPVESRQDVEKAIDIYRGRWRIEEYFKALKSGCAVEKRQLESKDALLNAIALFAPVAVSLLRVRNLAHEESSRPAGTVLRPVQIRILQVKAPRLMSSEPTIHEAMLAIARLGGHLPQNGSPGWMVLGRGYEELLTLEAGARMAAELGDVINP